MKNEAGKTRVLRFTMVEVVLAIGVILLGVVAVLTLFPVGLKSDRDAVGSNYAADAAQQFLAHIATAAKKDWASYIGSSDDTGMIVASRPGETEQDHSDWTRIGTTNLYSTGDNQIFGVKQGSPAVMDFIAVVRVWKSSVTSQTFSGSGWVDNEDEDYEESAGLNVEISWPAEIPYAQRNRELFYREIFKP